MQYGEIALVYDTLMYDMPYGKWVEFLKKNLKGTKILELGCGTGSITEILSAYYDITAVDISEDMLDVARQKLIKKGRSARLCHGDMSEFSLNKPLDSAICVCDGINYLTSPQKVRNTFKKVYDNIQTGGRFIFDISSAYKLKNMANQLYSEDTDDVTYIWRNSIKDDIINMDITFFITEDGEHYLRFDENHFQRVHKKEEITSWLNECGFLVISVTDDYTDNEILENTMRITFCAEKKG